MKEKYNATEITAGSHYYIEGVIITYVKKTGESLLHM